jgi:hypothetical protein
MVFVMEEAVVIASSHPHNPIDHGSEARAVDHVHAGRLGTEMTLEDTLNQVSHHQRRLNPSAHPSRYDSAMTVPSSKG